MFKRHKSYIVWWIGAASLLSSSCSFGQPQPAPAHGEESPVSYTALLSQLEARKDYFSSGFFRYTCDAQFFYPLPRNSTYPRYLELAFKNNRFLTITYPSGFPSNSSSQSQSVYFLDDGTYVYQGDTFQNGARQLVSVNRLQHGANGGYIEYLSPMDFGYFADVGWIADLLKQHPGALIGTREDKQFGFLMGIKTTDKWGRQYSLWIAPKYGYLCARWEIRYKSGWRAEYVCESVVHSGEVWIPMEGVNRFYTLYHGRSVLVSIKRVKVLSFHLNDVSDDLFKPYLPPGSFMRDYITHHDYLVGANGQLILDPRSDWNKNQPYFWRWAFILSLTALFFFLVSFIVYRQRRPRLKKG
jgi:hypothetical protein